ncbi:hypothetical protein EZV62_012372 [Acer yangbiense]|uniref:Dethiobiotin synthase n=1 Tax=Acer yangbiense TaxID=1000413 RepID=A0A5C7HWA2_9ROSI|nr:hypothetical protein EZV62_012372 [Acer yangbiense]
MFLLHRHCNRNRSSLLLCLLHHQHFSTLSSSPPQPLDVPLSQPTYMIWSSNTSLGKTLVSTGLSSSFLFSSTSSFQSKKFLYLKPIQTGFPSDSDSRFLFNKLSSFSLRRQPPLSLSLSDSVIYSSVSAAKSVLSDKFRAPATEFGSGMYDLNLREVNENSGRGEAVSQLVCQTLFAWEEAVSPHLAAERESGVVGDSEVLEMLSKCLREGLESDRERMEVLCVVETAGGVASPGPSGSLQCDLYRRVIVCFYCLCLIFKNTLAFSLMGIKLMAKKKLEVICHGLTAHVSGTIDRPFRLPGILVGDGRLGGISGTISAYESLKLRGYDVIAVVLEDHGLVNEVPLMSYLRNRVPVLVLPPIPQDPSNDLMEWFDESHDIFNSLKDIMLSAYTERIQRLHDMTKKAGEIFWWPFTQHGLVPEETVTVIDSRCGENFSVYKERDNESITQQFDACASWWTQGPDATLQTELARDMGYTAARFGHVMFPENVYEPALECAELLLDGVGKGWASRAYFSDNGSTAIEIALKMAFRKFSCDHGILLDFLKNNTAERVIKLKVLALKGSYHGDTLGAMEAQAPSAYTSFLQQPWYTGRGLFLDPPTVFMCNSKWDLSLPEWLHAKIVNLQDMIIHGSGGMHMIDPLFQRILVNECRNHKIPVIFDEVFTGFWRLGAETTADILGCVPDIACFAKLLTGGVIPLAVTLATDAVFDSFVGDSKLKALLHGHSYSAHAMGCAAAAKSMKWFKDPQTNINIISGQKFLRELWDLELVQQISSHPAVRRVVALGTVCALELQAEGCNSGYGSLYASSLLQKLREDGVYMRPLGNVIYLMCGPCTSPEICRQLLVKLYRRLEDFNRVEEKVRVG